MTIDGSVEILDLLGTIVEHDGLQFACDKVIKSVQITVRKNKKMNCKWCGDFTELSTVRGQFKKLSGISGFTLHGNMALRTLSLFIPYLSSSKRADTC